MKVTFEATLLMASEAFLKTPMQFTTQMLDYY
jgi:hypothetical protein